MKISGLHLLLTYRCTLACEHCFVYGGPWQNGVMTIEQIRHILQAGQALGTVRSIYFEGGEPFLYYATLLQGVYEAHQAGFEVGIVSNAYWATSPADARLWLEPFAGKISDLSVSSDLFHWSAASTYLAQNAQAAAASLGIPVGTIEIAQPQSQSDAASGQLPQGESGVMFRGRAAEKLAGQVIHSPLEGFASCPHEDLRNPGRLHVDPFGNLFVCQGISIGNLYQTPLSQLIADYQPDQHPITGPLLAGGPAELSRAYQLPYAAGYADACHACDDLRRKLRSRFADILTPDEVYGEIA